GGEDVDEAEQLGLERPPGHGPVEQALAGPRAAEERGVLLAAGLGDPPGQRLDITLGRCAHPPKRLPPFPTSSGGHSPRVRHSRPLFLTGNLPGYHGWIGPARQPVLERGELTDHSDRKNMAAPCPGRPGCRDAGPRPPRDGRG